MPNRIFCDLCRSERLSRSGSWRHSAGLRLQNPPFHFLIACCSSPDTPMDCQALGAPRLMGQEKPDLTSSGTMAVNQRWPRRGTRHHLH